MLPSSVKGNGNKNNKIDISDEESSSNQQTIPCKCKRRSKIRNEGLTSNCLSFTASTDELKNTSHPDVDARMKYIDDAWDRVIKSILGGKRLEPIFENMDKNSIDELVKKKDKKGNTLLHYAVLGDDVNSMRTLILNGADINADNIRQNKPIHLTRTIAVAQVLIDYKADINAKDRYMKTKLDYACATGEIEMAKVLLKNKADSTSIKQRYDLPEDTSNKKVFEELLRRVHYEEN